MHHPHYRIAHTTSFVTPVVEHWLQREIAQWVHLMKDRSDDPSHHERTLLPRVSFSPSCINTRSTAVTEQTYPFCVEGAILVPWKVVHSIHNIIISGKIMTTELLVHFRKQVVVRGNQNQSSTSWNPPFQTLLATFEYSSPLLRHSI